MSVVYKGGSDCPPVSPPSFTVSSGSQERRRLEERAELGSRWSWLQVRLEDLEERTRQMVELHKHIRSTKVSGKHSLLLKWAFCKHSSMYQPDNCKE